MKQNIERLCQTLGYQFKKPALLQNALTHRSMGKNNNERIEFLGDSVVNFVIAEALYHIFPKATEGELSRLRASLVQGETLAELATKLTIGDYLLLGPGEIKAGGQRRPSILAGVMEAVIGAIFVDSGFEECKACIIRWYHDRLKNISLSQQLIDSKTRLQEYLQGLKRPLPEYEVVQITGKAHDQVFIVHCQAEGLDKAVEGTGTSRRKAEQNAAEKVLEVLKNGKN